MVDVLNFKMECAKNVLLDIISIKIGFVNRFHLLAQILTRIHKHASNVIQAMLQTSFSSVFKQSNNYEILDALSLMMMEIVKNAHLVIILEMMGDAKLSLLHVLNLILLLKFVGNASQAMNQTITEIVQKLSKHLEIPDVRHFKMEFVLIVLLDTILMQTEIVE